MVVHQPAFDVPEPPLPMAYDLRPVGARILAIAWRVANHQVVLAWCQARLGPRIFVNLAAVRSALIKAVVEEHLQMVGVLRVKERQQRAGAGHAKGVVVDPYKPLLQKSLRAFVAFRLRHISNALRKEAARAASHVEDSFVRAGSRQPHHLLGCLRGSEVARNVPIPHFSSNTIRAGLRFAGEEMMPAAASRLEQERSVPSRYGCPGVLVRANLVPVPPDRFEDATHGPRADARPRARGLDSALMLAAGEVNDAVEKDNFLVVPAAESRRVFDRGVEIAEELVGGVGHEHLLLRLQARWQLHLARLGQEFMPFEECGGAVPHQSLVLYVETAHHSAAHLRPVSGGGEEERHGALLHGAATLTRLEVAAVVLGLPETFVKLASNGFAFDRNQWHVAVMEQVIKFEQSIAEWVFDLKLRPARFRRDAEIIEQRPDYPVTVFDVVVAGRGEQFPNPAVRLHGAACRGSVGEWVDRVEKPLQKRLQFAGQVLQPVLGFRHGSTVPGILLSQSVDGFAISARVDFPFIQNSLFERHRPIVRLRHRHVLLLYLLLKLVGEDRHPETPDVAEVYFLRVNAVNETLNLRMTEPAFQKCSNVIRIQAHHANAINVLTDVQLAVIAMHDNTAAYKRLGPAEGGVGKQNVIFKNAAARGIIVASRRDPIRLHREINSGVANIDDLQIAHGATRAEVTRADLSVGDALGAVRQFVRNELAERDGAQLREPFFILAKGMVVVAGVPAIVLLDVAVDGFH